MHRSLTGSKMGWLAAALLALPGVAHAQTAGSGSAGGFVQDVTPPATAPAPAPQGVSDGQCSGPECPFNQIPQAVDQAVAKLPGNGGAPEIDANDKAVGRHIVDGMFKANRYEEGATRDNHSPDLSLYYSYNFKADFPNLWKEEYWGGYANPKYWTRVGGMSWQLKPGVSASEAIQDWLHGRTIAECMTTVRALQTDALRAAVGNAAFDKAFGSADGSQPTRGLLVIEPFGSSVEKFLRPTDANQMNNEGSVGHRSANPGEHYYFQNHPKYLLKHPGGAWQGENALYVGTAGKDGVPTRDSSDDDPGIKKGAQVWTGFGADNMTEQELYQEMISAYNSPRDDRDIATLTEMFGADQSKWPKEYQENSGSFPDQITVKDVLTAQPYTIDGDTRTGGFLVHAGVTLDMNKVKQLRGHQQTVAVGGGQ